MISIEWFVEQLTSHMIGFNTKAHIINKIIDEAKEMHKQEIIQAFDSGVEDDGYIDNAEQYYQETFNK